MSPIRALRIMTAYSSYYSSLYYLKNSLFMAAPSYSGSKAGSSTVTLAGETIPEEEELSARPIYPEETSKEEYRTTLIQLQIIPPG